MGIFINLDISKSVTKKEWEDVYNETLVLIKNFPLAEKKSISIHGVDTLCLVQTEEHCFYSSWGPSYEKMGWEAVGDMETLNVAEDYFLPRDLIGDREIEKESGDAMLGAFPAYLNYKWDDPRFKHTYGMWGNKTQGEPYHIYLLAVACLIEARLGTKAFTYGDITRGQCKKAVEIANEYLENKIDVPDRCCADRLLKRISALEFTEKDKISIFDAFYLGTKDASFGEILKAHFSKDSLSYYWENRFKNSPFGTIGFNREISEYLLWGFEIDELCEYVIFKDKDGKEHYEEFVKRIMDAKLHLKDKNCADPLVINQEEERPYGIGTLFAQFGFAGARNKKVDRYIPIEEIRMALKRGVCGKIDVDLLIDEYLKAEAEQIEINLKENIVTREQLEQAVEQDASEAFGQIMDIKRKVIAESYKKYDINDLEDLMGYTTGDKIHPKIEKALGKLREFLDEILSEPKYAELNRESASEKYRWITEYNRYILLRKRDWEQVFEKLEDSTEFFARYYSLMRINSEHNHVNIMVSALMINDELYQYTAKLAESVSGA